MFACVCVRVCCLGVSVCVRFIALAIILCGAIFTNVHVASFDFFQHFLHFPHPPPWPSLSAIPHYAVLQLPEEITLAGAAHTHTNVSVSEYVCRAEQLWHFSVKWRELN